MKIPDTLFKIAAILKQQNYQCFLVGGAVRDLIRQKPVKDYDLATDALPEQVQAIFRRVIPTGIKHGTVTVLFKGQSFEVTTFRIDGKYEDHRRPEEVIFTPSIMEDLSRRDFTINAIAYNLITHDIYDPFNGRGDIKKKIIRAIGVPQERFNEDGLRLLRACRFAAQFDYTVEEATRNAVTDCAACIDHISAERIRDELVKIILSPDPVYGLELMRKCTLLKRILPELEKGLNQEQRSLHEYDVYYHSLYTCEGAPRDSLEIRLAALLHDIGKSYTLDYNEAGEPIFYHHEQVSAQLAGDILKRLKFPNCTIETVVHLIRNHMFHYTEDWSDGAVRRFIAKIGLEFFPALIELRKADQYGSARKKGESHSLQELIGRVQQIISRDTALSVKNLALSGNDIMQQLNLEPGKSVGIILNFLLESVLEDPALNTRSKLLEIAEKFYLQRLKKE